MAAKMMRGVGPKTVANYVKEVKKCKAKEEQSLEDRDVRSKTIGPVGRMMARDEEKGVAMMTEAASQLADERAKARREESNDLADARDVVSPKEISEKQRKKMADKIHRPFRKSPYDR